MEVPVRASTEVNNNDDKEAKEAEQEARSEIRSQEEDTRSQEQEARSCITVTEPEQWLCVAKLPPDISEQEFREILQDFGKIEDSFLMAGHKNGECKGYGFARYLSSSSALQARHVLDGQCIRGHAVACEWLKEGTHPLASLHSKVLYIDQLPEGFRDLTQFRKLFATVVTPPYCQIAQKHGVLQPWGLVEYDTGQQAEDTVNTLRGALLDGRPVRLQYCVPNVHAINIYMSFVNNPLDNRSARPALLDSVPSKDVYNQLECLAKHNPAFVQSLQSIMTASGRGDPSLPSPPSPSLNSPAVLALLLASHMQGGSSLSSLSSLTKQLEAGTSPVELLQQALAKAPASATAPPQERDQLFPSPPQERAPLLPSPPKEKAPLLPSPPQERPQVPDLSSLISSMSAVVGGQGGQGGQGLHGGPPLVTASTKSPQLQNMLYSAFQARVTQQQEEQPAPSPSPPSQETPPPQAYPPAHLHSYLLPSPYYHAPPPSMTSGSALTAMLSQPPPPPPQGHPPPPDHWAHHHHQQAAPLLQYSHFLPPLQALWPGPAPLYTPPPPALKRKGEEGGLYPGLDEALLKRQKLCGN